MIQKYKLISEVDNIEKGTVAMSAEGAINIKAIGIATTTIDNLARQDAFVEEHKDTYDLNTPTPVTVESPAALESVNIQLPNLDNEIKPVVPEVTEAPKVEDIQMPIVTEQVMAQEPVGVNTGLFINNAPAPEPAAPAMPEVAPVAPVMPEVAPVAPVMPEPVQEAPAMIEPTPVATPDVSMPVMDQPELPVLDTPVLGQTAPNPVMDTPAMPEVAPVIPTMEPQTVEPEVPVMDTVVAPVVPEVNEPKEPEMPTIDPVVNEPVNNNQVDVKAVLVELRNNINMEIDKALAKLNVEQEKEVLNTVVEPIRENLNPTLDIPQLDSVPEPTENNLVNPILNPTSMNNDSIPTLDESSVMVDETPIQSEPGKFIQF